MGIHGLKPLLKKIDASIFHTNHYTDFKYKTLAIDVSIFLHKYVHTDRRYWFSNLLNMLCKMKKGGVNIVAIFDGKNVPMEKMLERENRKVVGDKNRDRLLNIEQLEKLITINCINDFQNTKVNNEYIEQLEKLLNIKSDDPLNPHNLQDADVCIKLLKEKGDKIANQIEHVGEEHTIASQELCKALGIPYLIAYGEAEALASSLAYHKMVDGVLSRDTDCLAYQCPFFVCEFNDNLFEWTTLQEVLDTLDMSKELFIDLCIMCGCDYNTNIPRVGPATAHKKLMQYGSLEEYEKKEKKDTSCLRYKRCREIFTPYSFEYLKTNFKIPYKGKFNIQEMQRLLNEQNSRININWVKDIFDDNSDIEIE